MRKLTQEELEMIVGATTMTCNWVPNESGSECTVTAPPPPPPPPPPWNPPPPYNPPPPPPSYPPGGSPPPPPPPTCYNPPPNNGGNGVNMSVIKANEGGVLQPYVPNGAQGVGADSGVTLGAGIDLYGKNAQFLRDIGFGTQDVNRLLPFTGYHGAAAQQYLNQHPIPWYSQATLDWLSNNAINLWTTRDATLYTNSAPNGVPWGELPPTVQTAIVDMSYLMSLGGQSFANAAPRLWGFLVNNNFTALVNELDNFGSSTYVNQRADAHAQAIRPSLTNGQLPGTGQPICP